MPDLDEGKHYTADDMRRARAEGERRVSQRGPKSDERGEPARQSEMIATDASSLWSDPVVKRELITVAAKSAQIALRHREEAARQLGVDGEEEKQLLVTEDQAKHLIQAAVKREIVNAFASIALDISDEGARIKTAMQLKRTFDLEENSSKLLKRIAWQAFVGFLGFLFVALAAWLGIAKH